MQNLKLSSVLYLINSHISMPVKVPTGSTDLSVSDVALKELFWTFVI